uniref:Glucuronosyltransferase n=1 Tax=Rhabditophanes sp. KR3021 TaxID=114890 RepID=A0AC35U5A6_9BILA
MTASAVNVLLFLLGTNQFERNTFEFVAQQLALRHHTTITVKPILIPEEPRLVKPRLHLVKEKVLKNMVPKAMIEQLEEVGKVVPWTDKYQFEAMEEPYWTAHNHSCAKLLNSDLMDSIKKENVDVAIVYSGNACQLAILHVLGIPYIYFDTDGFTDETVVASATPWNLDAVLSNCPNSYNPHSNWLFKRLIKGICLTKELLVQSGNYYLSSFLSRKYQMLDGAISKLFSNDYEIKKRFGSFPDVNTLKKSAELYFINSDKLLESEYALPSNVIPVGGLHIDHVRPLFSPWNTTIASAKKGVIVVSLGSQANAAGMSASFTKILLNVFSKLTDYRIYWRLGTNLDKVGIDITNLPSHINLTTFIPQNDLLAQKRTKLLITNGGMSSIMEGIAHAVPMVGIPLYGPNLQNLYKLQNKGLAIVVEKYDLSETSLLKAIKTVLETNKFTTTAADMSKAFKSRPETAFERALYYIEYVGRHRGAKNLNIKHSFIKMINQISAEFLFELLIFILICKYAKRVFIAYFFSNKIALEAEKNKKSSKKKKD